MPHPSRPSVRVTECPSAQLVMTFFDTLNERGVTAAALRTFTRDTTVMASLFTLDAAVPGFYSHVTAVGTCGDVVIVDARIQGLRAYPPSNPTPSGVNLPVRAEVEVREGRIVRLSWHVHPEELRWQTGLSALSADGGATRARPPPPRPHHAASLTFQASRL